MKITLSRLNEALHLQAANDTNNTISMDGAPDMGGENLGMRPMQLLLASLGGCSSIDVLDILKKMKQEVIAYDVEIVGEREKVGDVNLFKKINMHFILTGNLDNDKVERAIHLSTTKYCSVAKMIDGVAQITTSLEIKKP